MSTPAHPGEDGAVIAATGFTLPSNETLQGFLTAADFDADLVDGRRVFMSPVEGVDLDSADDFAFAQDQETVDETALTRDVMVLRDKPGSVVVNVWAYTT